MLLILLPSNNPRKKNGALTVWHLKHMQMFDRHQPQQRPKRILNHPEPFHNDEFFIVLLTDIRGLSMVVTTHGDLPRTEDMFGEAGRHSTSAVLRDLSPSSCLLLLPPNPLLLQHLETQIKNRI